jgi:hypothetical protein
LAAPTEIHGTGQLRRDYEDQGADSRPDRGIA